MSDIAAKLFATPENARAAEQNYHMARRIAEPFMTPAGADALQALREVLVNPPSFVIGMDASYGYAREGQRSVVMLIEQCIMQAQQGLPQMVRDVEAAKQKGKSL